MPDELHSKFSGAAGGELSGWIEQILHPHDPHISDLTGLNDKVLASLAYAMRKEPDSIKYLLQNVRDLQERLKEAQQASLTDSLTGLYNTRAFNLLLDHQIKNGRRQPLSLAYADLSLFKAINDNYGHPTGDLALKAVASHLKTCCRSGDVISRVGGDEFTLLLPNCNEEGANIVRARAQKAFADFSFDCEGSKLRVGINMGVVCLRPDESAADFVKRADKAMQDAKASDLSRIGIARMPDFPPNAP